MKPEILLAQLHLAERLKNTTRHCYTSAGRHESVAEHSWRLALMAYWISDEFPDLDMDKVIRMCLIHDLGEAFTGDIPVFLKNQTDESHEEDLLMNWVASLPSPFCEDMRILYEEMIERRTPEAKLYKALDGLEAVIAHNESDLATWLPNEYDLQLTYAYDKVQFSPYLKELRDAVRDESLNKIQNESKKPSE